ncbi:hypothetical protein JKP88DRAFT_245658 [Tribonema minus]|uniref:Uncharacterized protein n=1 Tax=Tribonema minus TaxID=303371 RepID=A0A835YVC1_9STRA|nr:hypothetical protein JKP88DRAFT_245658 [Tribonema minus]
MAHSAVLDRRDSTTAQLLLSFSADDAVCEHDTPIQIPFECFLKFLRKSNGLQQCISFILRQMRSLPLSVGPQIEMAAGIAAALQEPRQLQSDLSSWEGDETPSEVSPSQSSTSASCASSFDLSGFSQLLALRCYNCSAPFATSVLSYSCPCCAEDVCAGCSKARVRLEGNSYLGSHRVCLRCAALAVVCDPQGLGGVAAIPIISRENQLRLRQCRASRQSSTWGSADESSCQQAASTSAYDSSTSFEGGYSSAGGCPSHGERDAGTLARQRYHYYAALRDVRHRNRRPSLSNISDTATEAHTEKAMDIAGVQFPDVDACPSAPVATAASPRRSGKRHRSTSERHAHSPGGPRLTRCAASDALQVPVSWSWERMMRLSFFCCVAAVAGQIVFGIGGALLPGARLRVVTANHPQGTAGAAEGELLSAAVERGDGVLCSPHYLLLHRNGNLALYAGTLSSSSSSSALPPPLAADSAQQAVWAVDAARRRRRCGAALWLWLQQRIGRRRAAGSSSSSGDCEACALRLSCGGRLELSDGARTLWRSRGDRWGWWWGTRSRCAYAAALSAEGAVVVAAEGGREVWRAGQRRGAKHGASTLTKRSTRQREEVAATLIAYNLVALPQLGLGCGSARRGYVHMMGDELVRAVNFKLNKLPLPVTWTDEAIRDELLGRSACAVMLYKAVDAQTRCERMHSDMRYLLLCIAMVGEAAARGDGDEIDASFMKELLKAVPDRMRARGARLNKKNMGVIMDLYDELKEERL